MSTLDSLDHIVIGGLKRVERFASNHARSVVGAAAVAMLGFAATAFSLAPLAPDAADLPRQIVTENVPLSGLEDQLELLAEHELELYRNDLTRASDTAEVLLKRLGVNDAAAAAFFRKDATGRKLISGRAGKMVQVSTDASGNLTELVARYPAEVAEQAATHFTRLSVVRTGDQFVATINTAAMTAQVRMGSGTIRNSLFAATDEARIPDGVATQMADIFSADIDMHRELKRGDTFRLIFETLTADGEPVTWGQTSGKVLAAEFVNKGRTFSAIWFKDGSGKGAYFDAQGQSKRRTFLTSPVEFSRVTSGFAMRFHPILQTWRKHNGVDYGAPTGTPVRSVADGTVEFAGRQNGYGNVVILRHGQQRSTLYGHLSRIDVRAGQRVEQGARVGAVGSTGWATGPHLHFEYLVNGQQQNPVNIAKSAETMVIQPGARTQFAQLAQGAKAQLDVAETLGAAGLRAE